MKKSAIIIISTTVFFIFNNVCSSDSGEADSAAGTRTADHQTVSALRLGKIPQSAIEKAKSTLHIGYGHTSHGSQITTGMSGLIDFANRGGLKTSYSYNLFSWNRGGTGGALDLREGGDLSGDCGYYPDWVKNTKNFLDKPENSKTNVIIWSWCGQAAGLSEKQMNERYLKPMRELEALYPKVKFVYMTGHLDGSGETGNLHKRNEQIREHCKEYNCWLFDFADIESYDPDGKCYLNLMANDDCTYDSDSNGTRESNWATKWQSSHTENVDWYSCSSSHSEALNANMKAYAAWWLWTRLSGWNGGK